MRGKTIRRWATDTGATATGELARIQLTIPSTNNPQDAYVYLASHWRCGPRWTGHARPKRRARRAPPSHESHHMLCASRSRRSTHATRCGGEARAPASWLRPRPALRRVALCPAVFWLAADHVVRATRAWIVVWRADEVAALLRSLALILRLAPALKAAEQAARLRLKVAKCVMVPMMPAPQPEDLEHCRVALCDVAREWENFAVRALGKYLGACGEVVELRRNACERFARHISDEAGPLEVQRSVFPMRAQRCPLYRVRVGPCAVDAAELAQEVERTDACHDGDRDRCEARPS